MTNGGYDQGEYNHGESTREGMTKESVTRELMSTESSSVRVRRNVNNCSIHAKFVAYLLLLSCATTTSTAHGSGGHSASIAE